MPVANSATNNNTASVGDLQLLLLILLIRFLAYISSASLHSYLGSPLRVHMSCVHSERSLVSRAQAPLRQNLVHL
ncbi:hypothetical protein F5Y16DRAFT_377580 [Xylariaceae sp. FL0255]|nr:hypothetical protein F5Y16DRAFT_377580 [Xylariaceae sp. FL0255]